MRKAPLLAVGVVVLLAAGLGFGYWRHQPAVLFGNAGAASSGDGGSTAAKTEGAAGGHKGGRHGSGPVAVNVATATAGELPVRRSTIGWIASKAATTITAQQQGMVTALLAENGQEVKAGDILVQLDDRAAKATLDRDIAAEARDSAAVTSTKADLARAQDLFSRKFDSQQQLDQATAAAASAEAVVKLDEANIAADRVVLDEMQIKAPHDGRLGAFAITVGSLITPGSAVVALTDVDTIEAVFTVSDADVGLLRRSLATGPVPVQLVAADMAAAPDRTAGTAARPAGAPVMGAVDFIDSTIAEGSGTMAVRAAVANTDRVFWPGEAVKVDIDLGRLADVVIVPTVAVQEGQSGPNVFVVAPGNTIDVRPVTVAGIVGDRAAISSGLKAGDAVVTEGQLSLAEGMSVAVRGGGAPGDGAAHKADGKPMVVGGAS